MGRKKYEFNPQADVKVMFEFNGKRRYSIADGFTAMHIIDDGISILGKHHYYSVNYVPPNGRANGHISFLSDATLPACLWNEKTIPILENGCVVGHAIVIDIPNAALHAPKHPTK